MHRSGGHTKRSPAGAYAGVKRKKRQSRLVNPNTEVIILQLPNTEFQLATAIDDETDMKYVVFNKMNSDHTLVRRKLIINLNETYALQQKLFYYYGVLELITDNDETDQRPTICNLLDGAGQLYMKITSKITTAHDGKCVVLYHIKNETKLFRLRLDREDIKRVVGTLEVILDSDNNSYWETGPVFQRAQISDRRGRWTSLNL